MQIFVFSPEVKRISSNVSTFVCEDYFAMFIVYLLAELPNILWANILKIKYKYLGRVHITSSPAIIVTQLAAFINQGTEWTDDREILNFVYIFVLYTSSRNQVQCFKKA